LGVNQRPYDCLRLRPLSSPPSRWTPPVRLLKLNHSCLLDEGVTGLLASLIMGERECLGGSDPKPPACLAVVPFEGSRSHRES
jgi:hypothetical protein